MSASNGGLIVDGQQRDNQQRELMIQAAVAYDETQKRIASLEDQLNRAVAALEAKNGEIDNLNLMLSQERNRNDNHRNERDQAVAERAEVLAILSNVRAMVEKAEIPMPLPGKRNPMATSLLIMVATSPPSGAAENPAQSGSCLTRAQAEQIWPHSDSTGTPNGTAGM